MLGLLDWLENPDEGRGIRLSVQDDWRFCSYADIAADVRRTAAFLRDRGLPTGVPVSLMLSRPLDFVAGFAGCLLAGLSPSPIATPLTFGGRAQYAEHVTSILRVAKPSLVLTDDELYDVAAEAATAAGRDQAPVKLPPRDELPEADGASRPHADPALLQFTSGSSGRPKGVRVTWDNLETNINAIRGWMRWGTEDSFASWLPLYHDMGLIGGLLTPLASQTDLWLLTPDQFIRSPLRWLECFGTRGATMTTAPTFGYSYVHRRVREDEIADMDFSGWRVAICGAERVDAGELADFAALLAPRGFRNTTFMPAYGLAEGTLAVTGVRPDTETPVVRPAGQSFVPGDPVEIVETRRLGFDRVKGAGWLTGCGWALDHTEVRILDEEGRPAPPGAFGEVAIAGRSVAAGYTTGEGPIDFDNEGWATGDSGFIFEDHLFIVGRIGDSLKVRGRRVHAEDLEAELIRVDGVKAGRCAVTFGTYDAMDVVVALVESTDAPWLDDVVSRLRSATSDTVAVAVFNGRRGLIPRTSSGKTRRRFLWNALVEGTTDAQPVYVSAGRDEQARLPWKVTTEEGTVS